MKENKLNNKFRTKKLISYSKRTKDSLILGFVFTILAVATDLLGPYIISLILDGELVEGVGVKDFNFYLFLLATYLLSFLLSSIFRYLNGYYFNKTANKVALLMQEDVFDYVQNLPISYFDSLPAGKVVSRITNDNKDVKLLFQVVLSQMTTASIYALGVYISLAFIDIRLFFLALLALLPIYLIFRHFKDNSKKFNYAYRRYLSDLNANLNENILGMEVIHAFNREDLVYDEFSEINDKVYREGLNFTKLFAYSAFNAMDTVRYLVIASALVFFGYGVISGKIPVTIGMLYIFTDYMIKIFDHMTHVVLRSGELEKSRAAADHIFELLQLSQENYGKKDELEVKGQITFENVSFYYKDENYVLKDINFKVKAGESVGFVGSTGSGKSTIMNLLFGFYYPQKGQILIDGKDIKMTDVREFRNDMSIVLQDPYIFSGTVKDNIALFDEKYTDEMVERALIEVGGEELISKLKKGIHTEVAEKGSMFSSGERQLLSFARALVRNPKILVLDEATANIDSQTEAIIQRGIEKLKEGRTTLIIAHRLSTIKNTDKIYLLDKGKIVEEGSHSELIEKGGIYKDMYLAQSNL